MTFEYREYFRSEHPRLLAERIREIFDHERSMLVPGFQKVSRKYIENVRSRSESTSTTGSKTVVT